MTIEILIIAGLGGLGLFQGYWFVKEHVDWRTILGVVGFILFLLFVIVGAYSSGGPSTDCPEFYNAPCSTTYSTPHPGTFSKLMGLTGGTYVIALALSLLITPNSKKKVQDPHGTS